MTLTLHCELYRAQFSRDRICYLFNSDLASPYLLRTLLQLMCIEEYVCRIWKNTLSWVAALLLPPPSPCSNIYLQLLLHSLDDTSSCCHYVCPLLPSPALMTRVYLLLCLFYFHSGRFRVLLFFAATKTASFPPPPTEAPCMNSVSFYFVFCLTTDTIYIDSNAPRWWTINVVL